MIRSAPVRTHLSALVALTCILVAPGARAQKETTLLQDDLQNNKRTKIDAPSDEFDAGLDAALGGPTGFSTKELERIEDRIRAELKRDRPRATPRLVVFMYPGKISAEKLRSMSEVNVDVELIVDPCERSVCRDAVARHIELVGRAIERPVLSAPGYKLTFKQLTLQTATQMHDSNLEVFQVPIAECVRAAAHPGGGAAWLKSQDTAESDYAPIVMKAISRHASERRVSLEGAPSVTRAGASVTVSLKVRGDRSRVQQNVIDALAAAAAGLRDNPKTPADSQIEVAVDANVRGQPPRKFRCPGPPVGLYLDRQLDGGALFASYVAEQKKQPGAQTMSFADDGASGGGGDDVAEAPDDNAAIAMISANFGPIGSCAKAEAGRNRSFKGVTVVLKWNPSGAVEGVTPKESGLKNAPIAGCLRSAFSSIRLPRFSGAARTIEYPIRMK